MKKKVVIAGVVVAAIAVVAGLSLTRGKQTEEEFSPSAGRFPCHLFGRLFGCQNLHNRLNRLRLRGRRPTAAAETCFRLQFTAA